MALLAATVVVATRHVMGHKHPILIPLLLIPALFLGWQEWEFRSDQQEFSRVATTIAGRDVSIQCQRFSGALLDVTAESGYVKFTADGTPEDTGRLERTACNNLRDWLASDKRYPTLDQVIAIQVLSHEAHHLAGTSNEAATECSAMQRLDEVAQWLGATPEQGRAIADRYYRDVYPRMPAAYRNSECSDGGTMDLDEAGSEWP